MADYRKAVRLNITYLTDRGSLKPQDLWQLSTDQLKNLATSLLAQLKESQSTDELLLGLELEDLMMKSQSKENEVLQLKFEIARDVLATLVREESATENNKKVRKELAEINSLIYQKELENRKNLSVEELQAMAQEKLQELI